MMNSKKAPDIIRTLEATISDLEKDQEQAIQEAARRKEQIALLKTTLKGLGTTSTVSKLSEKAQQHERRVSSRSEAWNSKMRKEASERMTAIWAQRKKAKHTKLARNALNRH